MDYKDMDVWIRSKDLCKEVYQATKELKGFMFQDLSRHSMKTAVSVLSNIAEGLGRNYPKEKIRFLMIARGSLYELESQLIVLKDVSQDFSTKCEEIFEKIEKNKMLINGTIRYLKNLKPVNQ